MNKRIPSLEDCLVMTKITKKDILVSPLFIREGSEGRSPKILVCLITSDLLVEPEYYGQ
jgi:hypothetical protein